MASPSVELNSTDEGPASAVGDGHAVGNKTEAGIVANAMDINLGALAFRKARSVRMGTRALRCLLRLTPAFWLTCPHPFFSHRNNGNRTAGGLDRNAVCDFWHPAPEQARVGRVGPVVLLFTEPWIAPPESGRPRRRTSLTVSTGRSDLRGGAKAGGTIARDVLDLFGNTPFVKLNRVVPEGSADVYAKLEAYSPGGSIKDRATRFMIEAAERSADLQAGAVVVEPTSGNTGIGLALMCALKGYRCIITMPEAMSVERLFLIERLGAEVELSRTADGMYGAVKRAEQIARKLPRAFMPQQYRNAANAEAHRQTTAQEIRAAFLATPSVPPPAAVVAGVGTGGTLTGLGEGLLTFYPGLRVCAVEPENSPVLSGGRAGPHRIQGIGAGFVPDVLNRKIITDIERVSDTEAYEMSTRLARTEGILAGISSGANCAVALRLALELGPGSSVVTVFPDASDRYVSLDRSFRL